MISGAGEDGPVLRVEQAADVVGVDVRDEHRLHLVGRHARGLERPRRVAGGQDGLEVEPQELADAGVHQHGPPVRLAHMEAGDGDVADVRVIALSLKQAP